VSAANSARNWPNPVTQAVVDGLLRRAEAQVGPVRALLLERARQLQARACASAAQAAAGQWGDAAPTAPQPAPGALRDLTALVDRLGRTAQRPAAVTAFRGTWARLRAEQRLRQALARVPEQPGPLHSSHLVHRALQTLCTLSPSYLDALLSHVDTLLWLDQTSGGSTDVPVNASQRPGDVRRRRKRPAA